MPRFPAPILAAALALTPCLRAGEPDVLARLPRGHPRLLLTDAELAADVAAARSDPLRAALHARIEAQAEEYLGAPPLRHELIGPRLLAQSRAAVGRIATCALAYRLTGDRRFLDRAREDLRTVAAFPDWNPSHFLDVAEMSFACAVGYDWLYPALPPGERDAVERALLEKSLVFAPAAYALPRPTDKRLGFPTFDHNWNQVCNAGLLSAALALADRRPDVARLVIDGVRRSLPRAMARYRPDGAYPEGPGYWQYGTDYNAIALELMEENLGTDFGLSAAPAFDRTALYRLAVQSPAGPVFNYADGSANLEDAPAYAWLALRYHHPAALAHARALLAAEIARPNVEDRFLALYAVWFPVAPDPARPEEVPLDLCFRGPAQIAVFRSAWADPAALFLGFKAGSNAVNHAHLDLGSFVLDSDGVRWAEDLGPDDYNLPGYFDFKKPRWAYFRLNNRSHNTVAPGDALQDPMADAPIVAFGSEPAFAYAVADLTAAYPGMTRRALRGVALLDRARVLVQDEWSAPTPPLRWVLATQAKVELSADGRSALLTQRGRSLRAEVLSPEGAVFRVGPAAPPTPRENPNKGASLLSIDLPASALDARVLAVLLSPVGAKWPARPAPIVRPLASWGPGQELAR